MVLPNVIAVVLPLLLRFSFIPGGGAAPCSTDTMAMNVTTTADLRNMIQMINCTGEGTFKVSWMGSIQLEQVIELSDKKELSVTGSTSDLPIQPVSVIDAGSTTGIFRVYNGSTLRLNQLMLGRGNSDIGAAIDARSFSSVYVVDCTFANNNATTGGAIHAYNSELHIEGDTQFSDNSAQSHGGAIYLGNSKVQINGNISFANNPAGDEGGAIYASTSQAHIVGESYFGYNTAGSSGAAISADGSQIYIDGHKSFLGNSAILHGGVINAISSNVTITGWTTCTGNLAGHDAGVVYARSSRIHFSGESYFVGSSVPSAGGVFFGVSSEFHVEGQSSFTNNSAIGRGGVITTYRGEVYTTGSTSFVHNSAGEEGGRTVFVGASAISVINSVLDMAGETSFRYNSAGSTGGAIFAGSAPIRIAGQTWFLHNSAATSGGALYAHTQPISIKGNTTFAHNTAKEDGGAVSVYSEVVLDILGFSTFSHNSADYRGGAISVLIAEMCINGTSRFQHNTGYDGGAIVAHQSPLLIYGSTGFVNNSADQDGGAINNLGSNVTILGHADLSSNTAVNGGAIFSSLSPNFVVGGTISFSGNHANFFGGAISLTDPSDVYITGTTFEFNTGTSGGAVSLTSTKASTGGFERCRFDSNNGSNGGALFLSTYNTIEFENARFVQGSVFLQNAAVELGGALYNTGAWEINDTVFVENTAGAGGLAVHDEGSSLVLWNTTFGGNAFSCPFDQYSDAHYDTGGTCRFEVVCQKCSEGCAVNQRVADVECDTIPACEEIPEGVSRQTAATLATFDLLGGYYRVSAESRVIRECYQLEACNGGTDPLDYCTAGYTGPYCAVCAEGYAPGVMNLCHECSTKSRRWTVGLMTTALVLGILAVAVVVFRILRKADGGAGAACPQPVLSCYKWLGKALPLSAIKIVVVVLQIVTQFTEIAGAVYPDEYEAFLSKMTSINLDIGFILSNSCLVTTDFYDRLVLATVGPLVVLAALFGTLWVARRRRTNTSTAEPILQSKRASAGLLILFFVYSSVSFTIFQTFVCDDLDDGISYLRADYSIVCTSDKHATYMTYASIMACVYPVGIPAFFAWWLASNRRDLAKPVREEMAHLESFRGLWAAYSPSCYYYEVVECSRRIALTGAAVFVLPDSAEQIAVIFLLAIVFTFISESLSPFDTRADMWLYRWGNAIILASMYVALLLKVELADKESGTSSLMTVLLIAANVFTVVIVVVQGLLLAKGLYESGRAGGVHPALSASGSIPQMTRSVDYEREALEADGTTVDLVRGLG